MNTALSVGKGISVMGREEATTQRPIYRSQDTQKIRSLTGRHVTVARAISFLLSLGLCGVGMFLVLFPRQVIQATTTPSTVPTDCNNDPNRDFQNSITYGEETYEFTQCRILGSVLAAFGISTLLSLVRSNTLVCFSHADKKFISITRFYLTSQSYNSPCIMVFVVSFANLKLSEFRQDIKPKPHKRPWICS